MNVRLSVVLLFLTCCLAAAQAPAPREPTFPPPPRRIDDEPCQLYSSVELDQLLTQLKTERGALDSEWKNMARRVADEKRFSDKDLVQLEAQLRLLLTRLRQEPKKMPVLSGPEIPAKKKPHAAAPELKKKDEEPKGAPATKPSSALAAPDAVDILQLAQTLFRAEQYGEALVSFRAVDLQGKKSEERAPILYLMAICLQRLGKTDEAMTLLRDAAKARGDEHFASYAEWQLEMLRWEQELRQKLQEIRARRQSVEKRL